MNAGVGTPAEATEEVLRLRLYVVGRNPKSIIAQRNLTCFCERHLTTPYQIEIVDLSSNPEIARKDQILATPTLVRLTPAPERRVIGDLSDSDSVIFGLDLPASVSSAI